MGPGVRPPVRRPGPEAAQRITHGLRRAGRGASERRARAPKPQNAAVALTTTRSSYEFALPGR
jgi:hypothetical protein